MTGPHPFAEHLRRATALEAVQPQARWSADDGPLPSLYLSHGAPPTSEDETWMRDLHGWARSLPKPRAILTVSAHWESAPLAISSTRLARGDVEELARFRSAAPGMPYAHLTVEHFTPLFVAPGAATDPESPVTTTIDGYAMGLAKRSFQAA